MRKHLFWKYKQQQQTLNTFSFFSFFDKHEKHVCDTVNDLWWISILIQTDPNYRFDNREYVAIKYSEVDVIFGFSVWFPWEKFTYGDRIIENEGMDFKGMRKTKIFSRLSITAWPKESLCKMHFTRIYLYNYLFKPDSDVCKCTKVRINHLWSYC